MTTTPTLSPAEHPPCPTGATPVYHWDSDHVPLGHRPCTTGTPTVYHWDSDRVPLGHRPCTTGTPTVYHWDTDHVPLGHRPCPTGTPAMYHWDTDRVPLQQMLEPRCARGHPPVSQRSVQVPRARACCWQRYSSTYPQIASAVHAFRPATTRLRPPPRSRTSEAALRDRKLPTPR